MAHASRLLTLPLELLDNIAFEVSVPLLSDLTPLLQTCRTVWRRLKDSHPLYARIFHARFSSTAIVRRAFTPTASEFHDQLIQYCLALKVVRSGAVRSPPYEGEGSPGDVLPSIEDVLVTCVRMLLDDNMESCGNYAQLEQAGTYEWVKEVAKQTVYDGSASTGGWPVETMGSSAALWCLWMLSSKDELASGSFEESEQIVSLLLPMVTVPFRYPSAYAPPNHFHLPLSSPGSYARHESHTAYAFSIPTHHGPYPVYLPPTHTSNQVHFGRRTSLTIPPASIAAKLLYFARREKVKFAIPPHLPANRSEAIARARMHGMDMEGGGRCGPTKEDVEEWNGEGRWVDPRRPGGTLLPSRDPEVGSRRWDADWWRMRMCGDVWGGCEEEWPWATPFSLTARSVPQPLKLRMGSVYEPGTLTGLWAGRMIIPAEALLQNLFFPPQPLTNEGTDANDSEQPIHVPIPPTFSEQSLGIMTVPVYMRLKEHVCYHPSKAVPCGGPRPRRTNLKSNSNSDQDSGQFRKRTRSNRRRSRCIENAPKRSRRSEERRSHEAEFHQGVQNAWFPAGTEAKKTWDGAGVVYRVPPQGVHVDGDEIAGEYVYETLKSKPSSSEDVTEQRDWESRDTTERGRFHDVDSCPGCRMREEEGHRVRKALDRHPSDLNNDESHLGDDEEIWEGMGLGRSSSRNSNHSYSSSSPPSRSHSRSSPRSSSSSSSREYTPEPVSLTTGLDGVIPHSPSQIPPCTGILDLTITGSTDARHGDAWKHYTYTGRVRPWDGMIAILRSPSSTTGTSISNTSGSVVFWGYVVGGQNFVGSWRVGGVDMGSPGWEGGFSLGKREG